MRRRWLIMIRFERLGSSVKILKGLIPDGSGWHEERMGMTKEGIYKAAPSTMNTSIILDLN